MDNEAFKAWRVQMGWSQAEAATQLGLSRQSVENYERGRRVEDGRPVVIPRTVELACLALSHVPGAKLGGVFQQTVGGMRPSSEGTT